jgi:hypothetical protein
MAFAGFQMPWVYFFLADLGNSFTSRLAFALFADPGKIHSPTGSSEIFRCFLGEFRCASPALGWLFVAPVDTHDITVPERSVERMTEMRDRRIASQLNLRKNRRANLPIGAHIAFQQNA